MSFQENLLDGLGQYLAEHGVGSYPVGNLQPGDTGIYIDRLPAEPDRGVAMSLYPVDDNTGTTDSVQGVQFRIRGRRGNRRDVKQTSDALFDALHDAVHYELGGINIVRSWRQSGTPFPNDGNDRQESTVNYYLQLIRTSPHRRD